MSPVLLSLFKNARLADKMVSGINCVVTCSLQLGLKHNFGLKDIPVITYAEIHMGLRTNSPRFLSNLSKIPKYLKNLAKLSST